MQYWFVHIPVPLLPECPAEGQKYFDSSERECVPCTGTCEEPEVSCLFVCRSGCGCPVGTVLDEQANACVSVTDCPKGGSCDCHMTLTYLHTVPHIMQHLLYQQIAEKGI